MAARPSPPSGRGPTRAEIASYLEENALLLEAILEKSRKKARGSFLREALLRPFG